MAAFMTILEGTSPHTYHQSHNHHSQPIPVSGTKPLAVPKQKAVQGFPQALLSWTLCSGSSGENAHLSHLWSPIVTEIPQQACIQKPMGDWSCSLLQRVRNAWNSTNRHNLKFFIPRECFQVVLMDEVESVNFFLCQDVLRLLSVAAIGSNHNGGIQNVS